MVHIENFPIVEPDFRTVAKPANPAIRVAITPGRTANLKRLVGGELLGTFTTIKSGTMEKNG